MATGIDLPKASKCLFVKGVHVEGKVNRRPENELIEDLSGQQEVPAPQES